MTDLTELVEVEILSPLTGFIIGLSEIGDDLTPAGAERFWLPVTILVTEVNINRGGIAAGLSGIDVGTCTINAIIADGIPAIIDNPFLRPGLPIRVRDKEHNTPLFTGVLREVTLIDDVAGAGIITTATDAVTELQNRTLYGAITGKASGAVPGSERFNQRLTRYINRINDVRFGPVPDDSEEVERPPGSTDNSFTALPAPANTTSSLTVVEKENPWTGQKFDVIQASLNATAAVNIPAQTWGVTTTITDLEPGLSYIVYINVFRAPGSTVDLTSYVDGAKSRPINPAGTASPDAHWWEPEEGQLVIPVRTKTTTANLEIRVAQPLTSSAPGPLSEFAFTVNYVVAAPAAGPWEELSDTVYESTAANHLALACDTVGAYWWVDPTNTVQFSRGKSPYRYQDLKEFCDDGSGGIDYGSSALTYTTADIVNAVVATNHSYNPLEDQADDTTKTATSPTSQIFYGHREIAVDLNFVDIEWDPEYYGWIIDGRLTDIVENRNELTRRPDILRIRATDHDPIYRNLDITQIVKTKRAGRIFYARINGVQHQLRRTSWTTTYTLEPVWR